MIHEENKVCLELYHGTLDIFIDSIKINGLKASSNNDYKDYLGFGVYFYNSYRQANIWAYKKARNYNREHTPQVGYAIIKAQITYNKTKCLDFSDLEIARKFRKFFREVILNPKEKYFLTQKKDGKYRKKFSYVVDSYCELYDVDIIIADIDNSKERLQELKKFYSDFGINICNEKQYCIKKCSCINNIETVPNDGMEVM